MMGGGGEASVDASIQTDLAELSERIGPNTVEILSREEERANWHISDSSRSSSEVEIGGFFEGPTIIRSIVMSNEEGNTIEGVTWTGANSAGRESREERGFRMRVGEDETGEEDGMKGVVTWTGGGERAANLASSRAPGGGNNGRGEGEIVHRICYVRGWTRLGEGATKERNGLGKSVGNCECIICVGEKRDRKEQEEINVVGFQKLKGEGEDGKDEGKIRILRFAKPGDTERSIREERTTGIILLFTELVTLLVGLVEETSEGFQVVEPNQSQKRP